MPSSAGPLPMRPQRNFPWLCSVRAQSRRFIFWCRYAVFVSGVFRAPLYVLREENSEGFELSAASGRLMALRLRCGLDGKSQKVVAVSLYALMQIHPSQSELWQGLSPCPKQDKETGALRRNFPGLIRILFLGLGKAEENADAGNDTHHYSDTAAGRRAAELGLFKGMGLLSGRRARHHIDHRYYAGPNGTSITTAARARRSPTCVVVLGAPCQAFCPTGAPRSYASH